MFLLTSFFTLCIISCLPQGLYGNPITSFQLGQSGDIPIVADVFNEGARVTAIKTLRCRSYKDKIFSDFLLSHCTDRFPILYRCKSLHGISTIQWDLVRQRRWYGGLVRINGCYIPMWTKWGYTIGGQRVE